MNTKTIQALLKNVKQGSMSIDEAVEQLRHLPFEDLGFAKIDHHRQIRCGFPEVIFCPGKTTEQIIDIFDKLTAKGNNVIASRAEPEVFKALAATGKFPKAKYEKLARMIVLEQTTKEISDNYIAVVTAGTADIPVAEEARVTAEAMGQNVKLICDVGVAGIHRLIGHSDTLKNIRQASVIIVVAGMEGALASVVGGLVGCPVIAVPTSVGYGASFEGIAALLTMLNSCAAGITVVNIDNGFGAAYAASVINQKIIQGSGQNANNNTNS
jgi:pyridinium-3,5-biscarboxylic acid mononucleotide synthase